MLFGTLGSSVLPAEVPIVNPTRGEEHCHRGEAGQGIVEYALILSFISIVAVAVLFLFGGALQELLSTVLSGLQN
jgi:Flp pilus assembly pilin Flp